MVSTPLDDSGPRPRAPNPIAQIHGERRLYIASRTHDQRRLDKQHTLWTMRRQAPAPPTHETPPEDDSGARPRPGVHAERRQGERSRGSRKLEVRFNVEHNKALKKCWHRRAVASPVLTACQHQCLERRAWGQRRVPGNVPLAVWHALSNKVAAVPDRRSDKIGPISQKSILRLKTKKQTPME